MLDLMKEMKNINLEDYKPNKFFVNLSRTIIFQGGLEEDVIEKIKKNEDKFEPIFKRKSDIFNKLVRDFTLFGLSYVGALDSTWDNELRHALARIKQVKQTVLECKECGEW